MTNYTADNLQSFIAKSIAIWSLENSQRSTIPSTNLFTLFLLSCERRNEKFSEHGKTLCFLIRFSDRFCLFIRGLQNVLTFLVDTRGEETKKSFHMCRFFCVFNRLCNERQNSKRCLPVFWPFTCGLSTIITSDTLQMSLWKIIFLFIIFLWIELHFT